MPRRSSKGPRLWLQPERTTAAGRVERAVWCILDDGGVKRRTGCADGERREAEDRLAAYITGKRTAERPMADRPLTLPAPMVRAILAGTKTQHRMGIKPQPMFIESSGRWMFPVPKAKRSGCDYVVTASREWFEYLGPHQTTWPAVGDRLWVRETWAQICGENMVPQERRCLYRSDATDNSGRRWGSVTPGDPAREVKWRPSTHMPRWASRATLVVTDVRVMRLAEISEEDAAAEGVFVPAAQYAQQGPCAPVLAYSALWEEINGPGSWALNPWVTATTFVPHLCNIDAMEATHG